MQSTAITRTFEKGPGNQLPKLIRVMKLTTLFLTFFWLHVTERTHTQTVTLSVKNTTEKQGL